MKIFTGLVVVVFVAGLSVSPAGAQTDAMKAELKAAVDEFDRAALKGPRTVQLSDEVTLALPAGEEFVTAPAAARLFRAMGQSVNESKLLGVVGPSGDSANWVVLVSAAKDGYIRDDDARNWKADELLRRISKITAASNPGRKAHGIPELDVLGWAQPPAYDATTHRLSWSALVLKRGEPHDQAHQIVNYQTVALGRDGHLALTMATRLSAFAANKAIADSLLGDIKFVPGKRYEDFDQLTDHVAEYGLAALVAGATAKKLGLFAVLTAWLLKFAKIGAPLSIAIAAAVRRFRKKRDPSDPPNQRR